MNIVSKFETDMEKVQLLKTKYTWRKVDFEDELKILKLLWMLIV